MKAIICDKFAPLSNLKYQEMPDPVPTADEVLIKVHACSVNFPDTLVVQGLYQFKPPFPFSPGSDVAGIIESVGENVKHLKVGDEVIGMAPYGGFAEKIAMNGRVCFPKPPGMNMVNAASFLLAYGTSYHALKDRANLQAGETLLVLGASGGVGLAAVELGKQMGAHVIAAASTAEKLNLCKEHGADELINYNEENLKERVKELTNKKGVDVIYDPVGGDYANPALRTMARKGRYLVVGFAAGEIPKIPLNLVLLKECSIVGVFWGTFTQKEPKQNYQNVAQMVQWFHEGKLKPHIHGTYPLENAVHALEDIAARKVKGKAVITMV
ncbi:MAG: NADPH2:quinone reductase [Saprospiraceae bacterium]|jgi:NADPH2:quinone reductase